MYFPYGKAEMTYLAERDEALGAVIAQLGFIERTVDTDLFSAVVHHIIGQQISTKAQETVYRRMCTALGTVDAAHLLAAGPDALQSCGMTFRKADYLTDFARKVQSGAFDLDAVRALSDAEAVRMLCTLRGVGGWTAEMILLFCLLRPDILSYDDLAIRRGLRMIYRRSDIDRAFFEQCRRRFTPYGSVASFYLWAVANGALPALHDPLPKKKV